MAHRAASPAEAAKGAITRDESNATARPRPALPSQHQGVAAAGGVIAGCWSGVATIATVAQGEAGIASPAISPRRFRGRHRAACMRAAVGRSSGSWTRGWIAPTASNLTYWPSLPGTGRIPVLCDGGRFQLPLRGSAGLGFASHDASPHRLPFSSGGGRHRNRRTQHIVDGWFVNTKYCGVSAAPRPRSLQGRLPPRVPCDGRRERSEEHTSELQSLMRISYAVFCLKKKKK